MSTKCTCRSTRRERFLNRECPTHGDAEERRRHEAARRPAKSLEDMTDEELEAEFIALFGRLDAATQSAVRGVMEGCSHE